LGVINARLIIDRPEKTVEILTNFSGVIFVVIVLRNRNCFPTNTIPLNVNKCPICKTHIPIQDYTFIKSKKKMNKEKTSIPKFNLKIVKETVETVIIDKLYYDTSLINELKESESKLIEMDTVDFKVNNYNIDHIVLQDPINNRCMEITNQDDFNNLAFTRYPFLKNIKK
jgi:hypothetical protein